MSLDELKQLIIDLEKQLGTNSWKFNGFKTPIGLIFHDNFVSFITFNFQSMLSQIILPLGINLNTTLKEKVDFREIAKEVIDKLAQGEAFSAKGSQKFQEILIKDLKAKSNKEMAANLTLQNLLFGSDRVIKKRLYSQFFISLFNYIEIYTTELTKSIFRELNEHHDIFDFANQFSSEKNPWKKLSLMCGKLELISRDDLPKVLGERTWEASLILVIEKRNYFAERYPLIETDTLKKQFPQSLEKADSIIATLQTEELKKTEHAFELYQQLEPLLHELFLLVEIGKECYGYLAMMDTLFYHGGIEEN